MSKEPENNEKLIGGMPRRTFCIGVGGTIAAFGLGAIKLVSPEAIIRPPGAQDEDELLARCIHCMRCVEACPRHVLVSAHIEDGLLAMRTPTFDFSNNYCDFCAEENDGVALCASACPTEAISRDPEVTANAVIGIAEINRDWCLAWRFKGCSFCVDACPEEAVVLNDNGMPVVVPELCNGCGACYSVCVSMSEGSILSDMTDRAIVVKPVSE